MVALSDSIAQVLAPSSETDGNSTSQAGQKRRVLLVDDHPITRSGVAARVNQDQNLAVCGEAESADVAINLIGSIQPDIAIIDLSLKPGGGGIELTRQIREKAPQVLVLVMSMHDEAIYAERAFRAGAVGYVMKQDAAEHLSAALQCVARGEIYLSPAMKERVLRRFVNKKGINPLFSIETLSAREAEVFHLIGDGASTREIAERLNLSAKTIDSYRQQLKLKLFLDSGEELVRHAVQWGQTNV